MCFGKFFRKQFSILLDVIAIFESARWFVSFLNSGIINLETNLRIIDGTFEFIFDPITKKNGKKGKCTKNEKV